MNPTPFTRAGLQFLVDLRTHNERDWFMPRKEQYRELLQEPAQQLIRAVSPELKKRVSKRFGGSDEAPGGSVMRVYRDVRFSRDKTPYKTNVGMMFFHEAGRGSEAPGFYLHLEPMDCFAGAGLWHPEPPSLLKIRKYLVAHAAEWKKVKSSMKQMTLDGERAARAPKGFDPGHPLIEDLKLKSFVCSAPIPDKVVTSPDFYRRYVELCRDAAPLVKFVCKALQLPF